MKNTVKDPKRGIQWGIRGQLEDFADDLAIMSHSHKQLQDKINRLIHFATQVGLIINVSKTEEMNIIEKPQIPMNINGENLKHFKSRNSHILEVSFTLKKVQKQTSQTESTKQETLS